MNTLRDHFSSSLHSAGLRGVVRHNEPLSRHTTWRVGGPADLFYQPAGIEDLALLLSQLPVSEKLFWLGLGSNVLVRDGGVRGTVIATSGVLNELSQSDAHSVRAEAGVACAKVARFAAQAGLVGGEFFAGIPGTMGGALAMNAGAFGAETWQWVTAVETIDRQGARHLRWPDEYRIAYRSVTPCHDSEEWFLAAHLSLQPGDSSAAKARIKELLERRNQTQPTQLPNAGSVFRNPPGDHAARLIENCGLKGFYVGGARVSEKHANFIVNTGRATAADIEALITIIAERVQQQHGIELVREIHIVGER